MADLDVFIVEDEEMLQELYLDVLSIRGHRVVGTASSGEEAVERIGEMKEKPELIIMDHRMPGMGGLSAARRILDNDPSAKIVLVSADENAVWEAMKLGLVGLRKPFNIVDLMSSLEMVINERGRTRVDNHDQENRSISMESGLYLVEEADGRESMRLFGDLLRAGYKGLVFSRKHPDHIRRDLGSDDVPMVWFTSSPVKELTCISPMNIQKMLIMVQSSISGLERTAILVLGFEYVLTNLQFERALNLVQVLSDRIASDKSSIVVFSMDTEVLEERQRRLFTKEFRKVE